MGQLLQKLAARAESDNPLRIGLIGAGKFATTFLTLARNLNGLHILGIADLSVDRVCRALRNAEWQAEQYAATSFDHALKTGTTYMTEDTGALIAADGPEIIVEATGNAMAGVRHGLKAIDEGRHLIMVNVEADALAGPLLSERASASGIVYSLAYGDQPALICELVDWAQSCGFDIVCAGKGTKYLPAYHYSTPDTVWDHFGLSEETIQGGELNPKMFNSFLDGSKSAIEMAAVANATRLLPPENGLQFPPCNIENLPNICRPQAKGGELAHSGTVEVVSSLERDGRPIENHLRWGVYVTFEASSEYVRRCFSEYGLLTDTTGCYATMYRPYHLIGLELQISVLNVGLQGEATGSAVAFKGDVIATAKRDLVAGEILDGEGGYCVYGKLTTAEAALKTELLPIGLAHKVKLRNGLSSGQPLRWSDISIDENDTVVKFRREMEKRAGANTDK